MNKYFTILGLLLGSLTATTPTIAQNICDGDRLEKPVFANTAVTIGVTYGVNNTIGGATKVLTMDIYEPQGDGAAMRPLVIFAHGGSFIGGSRGDMATYCQSLAKKGYVTATIDYRLYDLTSIPDSLKMLDVVVKAVSDMKAAVRFFRKDAATTNTYRIDPNNVFLGGLSAGGILSLHATYINELNEVPSYVQTALTNNGGLNGNTENPSSPAASYPSDGIRGMVNYFGALHRASWIQATDAPLVSIHGTADNIVPYGWGNANVCITPALCLPIISVQGSGVMHNRANSIGLNNQLITVPGAGHGDFTTAMYDSMDVTSARFLKEIICQNSSSNDLLNVEQHIVAFPNPTQGNLNIAFNGLNETYNVQLLDQLGRTVFAQTNANSDQFTIPRNQLPAGMYYLSIYFDNTQIAPVHRKVSFQ
jgi:para-nitrobenzyl esterase